MSLETPGRPVQSFGERVAGALRLRAPVYAEVSADETANGQAFAVVLLAGVLHGFGLGAQNGTVGVVTGVTAALLGWFAWTAVVFFVARGFGHRAPSRALLRALGFANAPGFFLLVGVVPGLGPLLRFGVVVWILWASVVAVQAVFELPRRRAVAVFAVAFGLYLVVGVAFDQLLGS